MTNTNDLIDEAETGLACTSPANLAAETLKGDLRDFVLELYKHRPKPWEQMTEAEQRALVSEVSAVVEGVLTRACNIIAREERTVISGTLERYLDTDKGLEAKITLFSTEPNVVALHSARGREILLITSGADAVMGERAPVEYTPDQTSLLDSVKAADEDATDEPALFDRTEMGRVA